MKIPHQKKSSKIENDRSTVTERNFEKVVEEEFTKMHKLITGCTLMDIYTLV